MIIFLSCSIWPGGYYTKPIQIPLHMNLIQFLTYFSMHVLFCESNIDIKLISNLHVHLNPNFGATYIHIKLSAYWREHIFFLSSYANPNRVVTKPPYEVRLFRYYLSPLVVFSYLNTFLLPLLLFSSFSTTSFNPLFSFHYRDRKLNYFGYFPQSDCRAQIPYPYFEYMRKRGEIMLY